MSRISIMAGEVTMEAELNDSHTAEALLAELPVEGLARTWGQEIYFEIPLEHPEENPAVEAAPGTIAYWPPGRAFCIFFGQRPAGPVNVLGRLLGDPALFRHVHAGTSVRLARGE